jgi:uncharacterized DUF497 family protein
MNEDQIVQKLGMQKHDFRVVIGRTKIDYDGNKEEENRKKHKYSLESGVYLLEKLLLSEGHSSHITSDSFMECGEIRHMHMAVDDDGYVVLMVTTMRPDETVRVISFRRASEAEREVFHKYTGYKKGMQSAAGKGDSG